MGISRLRSVNQDGDNIIITKEVAIPEPNITGEVISLNVPDGDSFKTEFILDIDTVIPLQNLFIYD